MRRRKSALIKSNNPHLAGGEQSWLGVILIFFCSQRATLPEPARLIGEMGLATSDYSATLGLTAVLKPKDSFHQAN